MAQVEFHAGIAKTATSFLCCLMTVLLAQLTTSHWKNKDVIFSSEESVINIVHRDKVQESSVLYSQG